MGGRVLSFLLFLLAFVTLEIGFVDAKSHIWSYISNEPSLVDFRGQIEEFKDIVDLLKKQKDLIVFAPINGGIGKLQNAEDRRNAILYHIAQGPLLFGKGPLLDTYVRVGYPKGDQLPLPTPQTSSSTNTTTSSNTSSSTNTTSNSTTANTTNSTESPTNSTTVSPTNSTAATTTNSTTSDISTNSPIYSNNTASGTAEKTVSSEENNSNDSAEEGSSLRDALINAVSSSNGTTSTSGSANQTSTPVTMANNTNTVSDNHAMMKTRYLPLKLSLTEDGYFANNRKLLGQAEANNGQVFLVQSPGLLLPLELHDALLSVNCTITEALLRKTADTLGPFVDYHPITLFAPSDEAFGQLSPELRAYFLSPYSVQSAQKVLENHLVAKVVYSKDALFSETGETNFTLKTLHSTSLVLKVHAQSGLKERRWLTVRPGELLSSAVSNVTSVDSSDSVDEVQDNTAAFSNSTALNSSDVFVKSSDILIRTGALHVIDRVILPSDFVFDVEKLLIGLGQERFAESLRRCGLRTWLSSSVFDSSSTNNSDSSILSFDEVTILVPSNYSELEEYVARLDSEPNNNSNPNGESSLCSVLRYHFVPGKFSFDDHDDTLLTLFYPASLQGNPQHLKYLRDYEGQLWINQASVLKRSITDQAVNGHVHLVDLTLRLPSSIGAIMARYPVFFSQMSQLLSLYFQEQSSGDLLSVFPVTYVLPEKLKFQLTRNGIAYDISDDLFRYLTSSFSLAKEDRKTMLWAHVLRGERYFSHNFTDGSVRWSYADGFGVRFHAPKDNSSQWTVEAITPAGNSSSSDSLESSVVALQSAVTPTAEPMILLTDAPTGQGVLHLLTQALFPQMRYGLAKGAAGQGSIRCAEFLREVVGDGSSPSKQWTFFVTSDEYEPSTYQLVEGAFSLPVNGSAKLLKTFDGRLLLLDSRGIVNGVHCSVTGEHMTEEGVLHVVEGTLPKPVSLWQQLLREPQCSLFRSYVERYPAIVERLETAGSAGAGPGRWTLFCPENDAFLQLTKEDHLLITQLLENGEEVVRSQLFSGQHFFFETEEELAAAALAVDSQEDSADGFSLFNGPVELRHLNDTDLAVYPRSPVRLRKANVVCTGGVIHVSEELFALKLDRTPEQLLKALGLTTFLHSSQLVLRKGLLNGFAMNAVEALRNNASYTLLVPTNEAFASVDSFDTLSKRLELLTSYILLHVVPGNISSFAAGATYPTSLRRQTVIGEGNNTVGVRRWKEMDQQEFHGTWYHTHIIATYQTSNGYLHVVDRVLAVDNSRGSILSIVLIVCLFVGAVLLMVLLTILWKRKQQALPIIP